jgi:CheY-like chemotaxis protein
MTDLHGLRVFVLEDEPIVAMMLEDMLIELGCEVIGPASNIAEGVTLAQRGEFDVAVLDININGLRSDPIAHALDLRGKLYMFATGYGSAGVPESHCRHVIQKPYTLDQLAEALSGLHP